MKFLKFSYTIFSWSVPIQKNQNALYMPNRMKRKEGRLMLKRFIRWLLPLMVLVLIATYIVLSPVLASYAAGPNVQATHTAPPHIYFLEPDFFIRH
jgi:hypothetical protein